MHYLLICQQYYDSYGPYRVYSSYEDAKKYGERWVRLYRVANNYNSTNYIIEEVKIK